MRRSKGNAPRSKRSQQPVISANSKTKKSPRIEDFSVQDLLQGKQLEIVTAALLLSGKLIDAVSLFRDSPVISVTLLEQFRTKENGKSNALATFLEENGDMTVDDIIEAVQKRMRRRR